MEVGKLSRLQPPCVTPTGTEVVEIKEWYQNREDMLELRHINKITGLHTDYFKPGHPQALRGTWGQAGLGWGFSLHCPESRWFGRWQKGIGTWALTRFSGSH